MITSLYAGILGLLYTYLSFATINGRRKYQISLGSGKNNEILHLTSAHSNFAGYAPILIFMIYLAESQQLSALYLHILGSTICLGRLFHLIALKEYKSIFSLRKAGMIMTLLPLIIMSVINIILFFK